MSFSTVLTSLGFHRDIPLRELLARYAPPPSRFVQTDGLSAHVRVEGEGPPLLLLHGTSSSLHTWEGWAAALSGDFRVVRVDLPGFGLTGADPHHDYSIPRYLRFVAALLDALDVEGPVTLAGSSLGGEIACAFTLAYPERVARLILVDAGGYPGSVHWPVALRAARVPVLGRLLELWTPRFLVARSARSAYGDPRRLPAETLERYFHLLLRKGNRRALMERLRTPPLPVRLAIECITVPTLLLWGEKDAWIPVSYARRFHADIEGSELVAFPGAGHVPMEEIPESTVDEVRRFLLRQEEIAAPRASPETASPEHS